MPEGVVALQLLSSYWLAVILPPTLCFSAIYNERTSVASSSAYSPYSHHQGRKFGGYKILPKPCKDTSSPEKEAGVCMFNYECTQRSGTVVGSCMDGFLYGTCCKLPVGVSLSTFGVQQTTPARPYTSSASDRSTTSMLRPHIEHSPQETYLLYKNGSVVQTVNSPEDFLLISKQQAPSIPQTSPLPAFNDGRLPSSSSYSPSLKLPNSPSQIFDGSAHTKPNDRISTFSSVSGSGSTKPFTTSTSREPFSPDFSSTKYATTKSSPHTSTSRTTDYFSQSSKFNFVSTTYLPTIGSAAIIANKNEFEDEENLIRVPTLTADGPHTHGTNTSISHILWLLNDTKTDIGTEETSTPTTTQSFYTWLSIQNNADKNSSPYFSTKPVQQQYTSFYDPKPSTPFPSTTMHHIPGPSFHVTPEVKITPKPQGGSGVSESAPTVIVLSSAQDTATPPKKPTLASYTTTASYNISYHYSPVSSTSKPYVKPVSSYTSTTEKPLYSSILITAKPSGSSIRPAAAAASNYNTRPVVADAKPSSTGNIYTAFPVTSAQPTTKPVKSTTYVSSSVQTLTKIKPVTIIPPTTSTLPAYNMQTTVVTTAKPIWGGNLNSDTIAKPIYSQAPIPSYTNGFPIGTSSFINVRPAVTPQNMYHHETSTFSVYPPTHLMLNSTTENNIFDFPPVRDPNVNFTGTQHEKPAITSTTTFGGDDDDTADGEVTPQFLVDKTLEDKMHGFVEKIVQSLQGNFEDLEKVLVAGESTNNVTVNTGGGGGQKKPTTPTKKPIKKPSIKPTTRPQKPAITTLPVTTPVVTKKPSKKPSLATPVILFQPSSTSQTTISAPNKKPIKVTTTVSITPSSSSTTASASDNEDDAGSTNKIEISSDEPAVDYRKECGVRPLARKKGRIVGGKGTSFGEWPWQVLVREATWLGLFTKNKCGGVLITEKYVITAAHCQPGFLANLVAVFGEFDITGEVESKRSVSKNVRRVIVHRQYDAGTFENDIALLELESPIQFDTHIVPICMPEDSEDFTGRMATVTGWGRLKYGGGVPSVLQEVQVPILDNAVCQHMFHTAGHPKVILSSFVCAGYANGQRDSCEGDSGGPLMMERPDGRWTLVATVSHGIKCAAPYLPGVYMRTTYYKPWLQTITGVQ